MKKKFVTIVGVGALGSHLVQFLRNEADMTVIDFDRVEAKNVLAQMHGKSSIGKLKVQALNATMKFMGWGDVIISGTRLAANNLKQLIHGEHDLLIDCVDNGATRRLIQQHARDHGIPCLHGALAADGGFGRVCWDERFSVDEEEPGVATCEDGAQLPMIALTASYLARAAQLWLREGKRVGFEISPFGAHAYAL